MTIELEKEGIKVNAVSPGFTKTNLNEYAGTETVEEGAREAVRVALLGPDSPTGTFSGSCEDQTTALNSWIAVWMINANLATLVKTTRVLDAAAFAIVLCRLETLLVGVERPREEEEDHAEKEGCEDQYVFHRSSHVVPLN
jgi:hypothetical protein